MWKSDWRNKNIKRMPHLTWFFFVFRQAIPLRLPACNHLKEGMRHKRGKLDRRTCGQFSYSWKFSSGRDKAICSYKPIGASWRLRKDIRQGNMPLIILRLYMGLQMAVRVFRNFPVSIQAKNFKMSVASWFLFGSNDCWTDSRTFLSQFPPLCFFQMKRSIQTLYYAGKQARQCKHIHSDNAEYLRTFNLLHKEKKEGI